MSDSTHDAPPGDGSEEAPDDAEAEEVAATAEALRDDEAPEGDEPPADGGPQDGGGPPSNAEDMPLPDGWGARFFTALMEYRLVVIALCAVLVLAGVAASPFDWDLDDFPRTPVPVDAIPDIGENQQIVYTPWPGRSPQDVEDQVTYPLSSLMRGIPGVKEVRASSMFGLSMVSLIFEDGVPFHWSRTRVLEKLASLPAGLLPEGIVPNLGPDATALGQIYWYTLEGHDRDGNVVGGFSLAQMRSVQDFEVKPALASASGIAEVASIGGYVIEYQIDLDPAAMRAFGVTLDQVAIAVRGTNRDVGARTIELNQVEYLIRGVGLVKDLSDLEATVITARDGVPVRLRDVASLHKGPAPRRGALDNAGAESVGGVAVVRYGGNPLEAIKALKAKIAEVAPSLPKKTLADGTVSQLTIVPFYDRSQLIGETLDTLEDALVQQLLITAVVILLLMFHLRSAILVGTLLPVAVLMTFAVMRQTGVDANVVSLAGIAIAIGTMVDLGIVVTENVVAWLRRAPPNVSRLKVIGGAVSEVATAVLTSVATTIISFLPVFALEGSRGRLFGPVAWTKTFAIALSVAVALLLLPALASVFFGRGSRSWLSLPEVRLPERVRQWSVIGLSVALAIIASVLLADAWRPLGYGESLTTNVLFVLLIEAMFLGSLWVFLWLYPRLLRWALQMKAVALLLPLVLVLWGWAAWRGADEPLRWLPEPMLEELRADMPGMDGEEMPRLSEGSFLYMPSTMPHASIGATLDAMKAIDRNMAAVPEVDKAVGKLGRAETALDPAPVTMIETIVTLKPEWSIDQDGERVRNWRDHIHSVQDIWDEVVAAAQIPELTSAPFLQPIEGRIVMLQSGMRAPMGMKIRGPSLEAIALAGKRLAEVLDGVAAVRKGTVVPPQVVGKPYLEVVIDREAIGRHGLTVAKVQQAIEVAIGGRALTTTVEGRERYAVRLRYQRELRDSPEAIQDIQVTAPGGREVPIKELANLRYTRGPTMIRSEDGFLVDYLTFGAAKGVAPSRVVAAARSAIETAELKGDLVRPKGARWRFAGTFEQMEKADAQLLVLVPIVLALVFCLLYLQFKSVWVSLMVFTSVAVAMGGGFIMVWLWGQPDFLDLELFGHNLRDVFHLSDEPMLMSTAVWVGFIALIGIATDDGVIMATYLKQRFQAQQPDTVEGIRASVIAAGCRRIRPCLMTTATTVLALLPVLASNGRGAEIMVPMAVPVFGGMLFELVTLFVVPVLYSLYQEVRLTLATWAQRSAAPKIAG